MDKLYENFKKTYEAMIALGFFSVEMKLDAKELGYIIECMTFARSIKNERGNDEE